MAVPLAEMIRVLEYEANIQRSIRSSGENKSALRGQTTCSDPVGIVIWGGRCHVHKFQNISLELHNLKLKTFNKGNVYVLNEISPSVI